MFKIDKIILIELHIVISLIFRVILRIFEYSKFLSFSLFITTVLVLNDLWPKNESFKLLFLVLFTVFNLIFFVICLNNLEKDDFINLKKIRLLFQKKLKLTNYELFSVKDTKDIYEKNNKSELWFAFIESVKNKIREKYTFKIKYFFLIGRNIDNLTKLSVIIWLSISYLFISNSYYKDFVNSFSIVKNVNPDYVDIGMNIWIIPRDKNRQDQIFVGNLISENKEIKSFLVQDGSKLLINFYNVKKKNIKVSIRNKDKSVLSQKFSLRESDLLEYNEEIQSGEYNIYYKKKIIKKFIILKDKQPKVNFIKAPKVSNNNIKFMYSLKDENNLFVWLEIFNSKLKTSEKLKIDKRELNKTLSKPKNYILLMKNQNSTKKQPELIFEKNLSYLPLAGKKVSMRLGGKDQNNQFGFSKTYSLTLPKKIFNDRLAKKLIKIREDLINGQDFSLISEKLSTKDFTKSSAKVKQMIEDIFFYYEKNNSDVQTKREVLVNEFWKIAIILEMENLENLKKKISDLREEIKKLINTNFSEEILNSKLTQLENLLEKYRKRVESDNVDEFGIEDKDLKKKESKDQQSASTLEKAKRLLDEVDTLINKNLSKENKSKTLLKLQKIYKHQKELIDQSFSLKDKMTEDSRNYIYKKQEDIFNSFKVISKDIEKFISSEKDIIQNIRDDFNISLDSLNPIQDGFIKNQIRLLQQLKELFLRLTENAKSKQKEDEKLNNGQKKNMNNTAFDVPIIFEENQHNKLIERIRRMTNEDKRIEKEKKYLKRLLPDF